jgi:hypothetical protein
MQLLSIVVKNPRFRNRHVKHRRETTGTYLEIFRGEKGKVIPGFN